MAEPDNQPNDQRVTVSLSTLRAELTSLELRLVDRLNGALQNKADRVIVEQHSQRLSDISARLQQVESTSLKSDGPIVRMVNENTDAIKALQAVAGYKKWLWAQSIALAAIAIPVIVIAATSVEAGK